MIEYKNRRGLSLEGFSVEVCKAWEKSFFQFETQNTRKVAMRASMVFGQGGSVYKTLRNLSLKGLGGTQGGVRQFVSWIHINELYKYN